MYHPVQDRPSGRLTLRQVRILRETAAASRGPTHGSGGPLPQVPKPRRLQRIFTRTDGNESNDVVTVNGTAHRFEQVNCLQLLERLSLSGKRVALERNGESCRAATVPRRWPTATRSKSWLPLAAVDLERY